jgi:hypothetical protein
MRDVHQWNLRLRVMLYRRHVQHRSPRNFQLDLFTPDDGHFEYHAVATNLTLSLPALFAFIAGRGAQEKTIAELKGEFALDVVPTKDYTPTARGSSSASLPITSRAAFSSRRSPNRSPARGSAPMPICSVACGRCAFCSSPGRAG